MTATDPIRLVDGLDAALSSWAAPVRPLLPSAIFCAEPSPDDPAALCGRLAGHPDPHAADGGDTWHDTEETDR